MTLHNIIVYALAFGVFLAISVHINSSSFFRLFAYAMFIIYYMPAHSFFILALFIARVYISTACSLSSSHGHDPDTGCLYRSCL